MLDDRGKSTLDQHIQEFIKQKRACGWTYEGAASILYRFDAMASERFPGEATITKEMCDTWISLVATPHPNGLFKKVTPLRQFARYLVGIGIEAYMIPSHIPGRQVKYEAHIYTDEEIGAFFSSVDACQSSCTSPVRFLVIPALFRMLYCCGLRSSEARLLRVNDVNIDTGKIVIRESKGWRARVVYMSTSMTEYCKAYEANIDCAFPDRIPFFPNAKGGFYNKSTIGTWFHEFWDPLEVAQRIRGNRPRVHDFRHTFAVKRIDEWCRQGYDLNALYPFLSEYMGHSNFADTDYYLQLTETFHPDIEQRMAPVNENVLPEVCYAETQ